MDSISETDLIKNILKPCFPKADKLRIMQNSTEADNLHFTSKITRLVVEYEEDNRVHSQHLVVKVPVNGSSYSFFDSFDCFEREISMYQEVLPRIEKFLDCSLIPIYYHTTESKILTMEDVTAQGYESGEKLLHLNLDESYATVKAMASFHAASHKLHQQDPHYYKDLMTQNVPAIEFRRNIMGTWEAVMCELLKRKYATRLIPKFKAAILYLKKDDDEIRSMFHQSKFKFVVLNHGDFRKDNLLLKYDSNGKVDGVKLVDFQTCLWSSPLNDIFYLFATSVSIDVIETHFDSLIDWYLQCLNEKLQTLGCSSTYKRPDFEEDFKHLRFLLVACVLCLCCLVCPLDHAQQQATFSQANNENDRLYDICLEDERFVRATYGWLIQCEKLGVFDAFENVNTFK